MTGAGRLSAPCIIRPCHETRAARTLSAAIGWHRDRANFGDVIGVSLVSPCTFRMRRRRGSGWERAAMRLNRRSVYLMRGPSRDEWEHSIPAVDELRYSIIFRSMRSPVL